MLKNCKKQDIFGCGWEGPGFTQKKKLGKIVPKAQSNLFWELIFFNFAKPLSCLCVCTCTAPTRMHTHVQSHIQKVSK